MEGLGRTLCRCSLCVANALERAPRPLQVREQRHSILVTERIGQRFGYGTHLWPGSALGYYRVELHQLLDILDRGRRFKWSQVADEVELERIETLVPFIPVPSMLGILTEHQVYDVDAFRFRPAQLLAYRLQAAFKPFRKAPMGGGEPQFTLAGERVEVDSDLRNSHCAA
jgi:hypothetical protein